MLNKFLLNIFHREVPYDTVPKRDYLITLPYLGPLSDKTARNIRKIFQDTIKTGKINVVFKTQRRLSHMLRFKDVIPSFLESLVIYLFKCPGCNAGYIGETRAHIKTRACQHLRISPWTGVPTKGGVATSISGHIEKKNCNGSVKDFSVINREPDYHLRLVKESLFIKLYDYDLNARQTSTEVHLF